MSRHRYTVRRLGWHQAPHGDPYERRLLSAVPVAEFDTFDAAEYHRRALEHDARSGENPFRFGGAALFFQTSLDAARLHDWLLDAGIDPPVEQLRHRDWKNWWDAFAHTWTEDQLAHAWNGLDKVRFYDLIGGEVEEQLWHVLEIPFDAGEYPPRASREGGLLAAVYRTETLARTHAARLNDAHRTNLWAEGRWWAVHRYQDRAGYETDPRERDVQESVFHEVTAVPTDLPSFVDTGFLLQRRAFDRTGRAECRLDAGSRVPVRICADRASALVLRDELTTAAREILNPFRCLESALGSFNEDEFLEAIERLQPPLPWPGHPATSGWGEWWELCQDELTVAQRNAGWELFDDYPLFEVLTVTVRDQ